MSSTTVRRAWWDGALHSLGTRPPEGHNPTNSPIARSTPAVTQDEGTTVLVYSGQTACPLGHAITAHQHVLLSVPGGSDAVLVPGASASEWSYVMDVPGSYTRTYQGQCSEGAWSNLQTRVDTAQDDTDPPSSGLKGDYLSPYLPDGIGTSVLWYADFYRTGPDVPNPGFGTNEVMDPAFVSFPITVSRGGITYDPGPQNWPTSDNGARPRVVRTAGTKVWPTEIWTRNPGGSGPSGKSAKGYEWVMALLEQGIAPQRELYLRFLMLWPGGWRNIGNMKLPGLNGSRGGTSISATAGYLNHGTDYATYGHFSMGWMSDNGSTAAGTNNASTTEFIGYSAMKVGPDGVNHWDYENNGNFAPHFFNVGAPRGTAIECIVGGRVNSFTGSAANRDGTLTYMVTRPSAASRTTLASYNNVTWTDRTDSLISAVVMRNFWGGPEIELPSDAPTTAANSPHLISMMVGTSISDFPRL